jgi:biotin operon repressor
MSQSTLRQVLTIFETANEPLSLPQIARELGVSDAHLEAMIQFWVRKGRLVDDAVAAGQAATVCACHACGRNCPGPQNCSFALKCPRTITLLDRAPGSR